MGLSGWRQGILNDEELPHPCTNNTPREMSNNANLLKEQ